jgi:hypothetical protein
VLDLGADVCLRSLDQILQPSFWCIRQNSAFVWSHHHTEFRCLFCYLRFLGNALLAGVAEDDLLISMQELSRWSKVVHVGGCGDY